MAPTSPPPSELLDQYDVAVVGAGIGGIYAVHRFTQQGLSVLGLEGAAGVGGVWYHNRYPGARVDVDSLDYCYYSQEIFDRWRWSERYAAQPELLAYLNFVADTFDVKRHFRFETWLTGAQWDPDSCTYEITTSTGLLTRARFLVMTTGNLSKARTPPFPGLQRFQGEWVQTSHWPHREVELDGRRIGAVGTGSTGVQVIPELAKRAEHLWVFQRTPNYVVPAQNAPLEALPQEQVAANLERERAALFTVPAGAARVRVAEHPASHYSEAEQHELMDRQWQRGGQGMNAIFTDQGTDRSTNEIVANFVRDKVRAIVDDPEVAETLVPDAYPIGTRRLALDTGYYETFNRPNVSVVDVQRHPIEEITETGVRTANAHYEVDLLVFALGFHAFTGALDAAGIRNAEGASPTDGWAHGPRTLLGLMTTGFPNLFVPTGPGSPSVLANLMIQNEYAIDWIGDAIAYVDAQGKASIEPTEEGQDRWTSHAAELADPLLRRAEDNYMVHVNADDASRVFIPYSGGFHRWVEAANAAARDGYEGFTLRDRASVGRSV